MPRCVRLFLAGGVYHVYCRVARGEFIFNEPGEVEHWVQLVAFVSRLFDLRVLAWCLLSNHYHMVVQTGSTPLCDAMARLQGRYAKEYNRCLFATFAVSWLAYPTKDVAAALGKASGSVSRWLSEGLELQLSEPSFRTRLERLREAVGGREPGAGLGGLREL